MWTGFGNLTTNVGRGELEQIVSSVGGDPRGWSRR
jgi:hypothetical protein